jgi:3-mercaptopyruvate sulfurtransferase SseA
MTVRLRVPVPLLALLAALFLPGAVPTAKAQKAQFEIIKVAELNALLQKGTKVSIVDVRSRQEYLTRHIKGAVSVPLDTVELRAGEIPRQGLVVLY